MRTLVKPLDRPRRSGSVSFEDDTLDLSPQSRRSEVPALFADKCHALSVI